MIDHIAADVETTFFDDVCRHFDNAARFTNFSPGLLQQIRQCNSVYRFSFPLRGKNDVEVIKAWRVEHSHHQSPTELELVNSALEDTMAEAYREIRKIYNSNKYIGTLRTAAFVKAINQIGLSYLNMGIFP